MIDLIRNQIEMFAIECSGGGTFFNLPPWYKYVCAKGGEFVFPNDIALVALAVLEILLRIAGIVAIAFVVFGGIKYVVSQGEPDKVGEAKNTIINALVGLIIATFAVAIVSFVGNRIG